MSLNYSYKNVANSEEAITDENWPLVQNIIFYTMPIGINTITAKNVEEFRKRLLMISALDGYKALQEDSKRYSLEFLTSLIGLSTNASSKTITEFNKGLLNRLQDRISDLNYREQQAAKEEASK